MAGGDSLSSSFFSLKNAVLPPSCPGRHRAPSAEAWGMLKSYRRSDFRKDEFWDKMFSKLIPSKAQLETRPPEGLDDAGVTKIIERLLAIKADVEAQGA